MSTDEGTKGSGATSDHGGSTDPEEPYGFMERELAFKLLASHAMVDKGFYDTLRATPRDAAAQLHIALTDRDVEYIGKTVDWQTIDKHAEAVRNALKLEEVTHSW